MTSTISAQALDLLGDLRIDLIDDRELLPLAWPFRTHTRVSDSFYLAAASALGVPLLTTDGRLGRSRHGAPVVTVT